MVPVKKKLNDELEQFLDELNINDFLVNYNCEDGAEIKKNLSIFKNEAKVALSLIIKRLSSVSRILEVGAGLCLLSLFLKKKGFNIVALEPIGEGFGFFFELQKYIISCYADVDLVVLDIGAESLSPQSHGMFDLIFSSNVIEHINHLPDAFHSMNSVMSSVGVMVHSCPNYVVPYEPHYGIPVIKMCPVISKWLFSVRIKGNPDVWDSLNFITYFKVKGIAKTLKIGVSFEPELTFRAFERIQNDLEFQKRHLNTFVGKIFRVLVFTNALNFLRFLPAWASTPMIFVMSRD